MIGSRASFINKMLASTLLGTATLAVTASGFLLPPGATPAPSNEFWAQAPQVTIEVACPGCGFALGEGNGPYTWIDDVESALVRCPMKYLMETMES